jgi:putative toxin-antitoxin system antitoxin component (TIGR02293 family)
MAKVIVKAHQVFEDEATAIQWLKSPLKVLGGVSPIDLFDTSFGVQMVLDVLGRIEQGIYS